MFRFLARLLGINKAEPNPFLAEPGTYPHDGTVGYYDCNCRWCVPLTYAEYLRNRDAAELTLLDLERTLQSDEPPHDESPSHPTLAAPKDADSLELDGYHADLTGWVNSWDGHPGWVARALAHDLPTFSTHQGAYAHLPVDD